MKKRVVAILMATVVAVGLLAGCGSKGGNGGEASTEEGKVINIYSWNDEFRERLEAIYPEVESTSKDGTVTTLKDGTEIHWIINPNQDGVYQQKLDEALMKQADVDTDDKVDIFLSETDYVYKYTDAEADTAVPLKDLGIDPDTVFSQSMHFYLFWDQVLAGDLDFFFDGITIDFDDFHPVQQGGLDGTDRIGGSDKHYPGKVIIQFEIVIVESIVLFGIKYFQQG